MAVEPAGKETTYAVLVSGTLHPAILSEIAPAGTSRRSSCTVFRVELQSELDLADLAALLERRGHVLVSARRIAVGDD